MKIIITFCLVFTSFLSFLFAQDIKGVFPIDQTIVGSSGTTRAVVVGISDYQNNEIPNLRFADRDAEAFAQFLRSEGGGMLDDDHLILLINEQATIGKLVAAFEWLIDESKEGDKAIIFFSGHGDVVWTCCHSRGVRLSSSLQKVGLDSPVSAPEAAR